MTIQELSYVLTDALDYGLTSLEIAEAMVEAISPIGSGL
jgi:hypothetical protein